MLENIEILGATVKNGGRKRRSFFSFWDRRNRFPEPTTNGVRARCIFFPNRHVRERSERGSKLGVRECVGVYRSERDRVVLQSKVSRTDGRKVLFWTLRGKWKQTIAIVHRLCWGIWRTGISTWWTEGNSLIILVQNTSTAHSLPPNVIWKKKTTVKHWEVYRARARQSRLGKNTKKGVPSKAATDVTTNVQKETTN